MTMMKLTGENLVNDSSTCVESSADVSMNAARAAQQLESSLRTDSADVS